ncbi:MAG: tetratricopeptide repeat protein [Gammaproteobacteria bacterium]|nr:tetratricopeptide repeat protein [Gammaproteobacteria bacterium]MBT8443212.1 tetratricopeptide repeat protein [Gammaproteobacteria bacterium]NND37573.1 tetratricopeptide repeat protein [Gammaproteobacteria bacterium]
MDEQLTDEQQAEIVRNWVRDNGGFIFGGIVVAVGGLFGWQQWQDYQNTQAERASATYEALLGAVRGGRTTQADEFFADLNTRYSGSAYVDQARFVLAKSYMDRSDFEPAADHLAAIVANTSSDELRHIAALRLARVRLQQRQFDVALDVLGPATPDSAFASRYHDVRGDIYFAQGRTEEARAAYAAALNNDDQAPVIDAVYVQAKLDALGGDAAAAEPAE